MAIVVVWRGLLPRVGVEGSERIVLAALLLHTLLVKVPVVDKDLVLTSASERAESKVAALRDTKGGRPGQERRAGVDELNRVVSGVVPAGGNGARW